MNSQSLEREEDAGGSLGEADDRQGNVKLLVVATGARHPSSRGRNHGSIVENTLGTPT